MTIQPTKHNTLFEYESGEKELKLSFLRSKCKGVYAKKLAVRDECREYVIKPRNYHE